MADKASDTSEHNGSHKSSTRHHHNAHNAVHQNNIRASSSSSSHHQFNSKRSRAQSELSRLSRELDEDSLLLRKSQYSHEVQDAIQGALYIANHLKQDDEFNRVGCSQTTC